MNIPIVITSNFDTRLRKILKNFQLTDSIEHFVLSGEVGVEKPNVEIFQKIFDLYKTELDSNKQILHIGDSLKQDFIGATNFGAEALLYGQKKNIKIINSIQQISLLSNLILV